MLRSQKTRLSRIGVCKLLLIGVASWQATILEAADLEFDYPRTRLALAALVEIADSSSTADKKSTISLEGAGTFDERSLKTWSDAYLALTDSKIATWVSPQSAPPILPPYHAGAANSPLTQMLADGHQKVKLTEREMDLISCWIDLGVPFAGSYTESMAAQHIDTYQHYADKRRRWADEESRQIEALIRVRNELEE